MSLLLAYCIQLNSYWSSHFKSANDFFFFFLFLSGHLPYAGRRRPLQRVRLRSRATSGALTTSNPDSLWHLFYWLWSATAFRQWGVIGCNSGPADLTLLRCSACLQAHVWLFPSRRPGEAWRSQQHSGRLLLLLLVPQGWHRGCCGHPPVHDTSCLNFSADILYTTWVSGWICRLLGERVLEGTGRTLQSVTVQYVPVLLDLNADSILISLLAFSFPVLSHPLLSHLSISYPFLSYQTCMPITSLLASVPSFLFQFLYLSFHKSWNKTSVPCPQNLIHPQRKEIKSKHTFCIKVAL